MGAMTFPPQGDGTTPANHFNTCAEMSNGDVMHILTGAMRHSNLKGGHVATCFVHAC